MLLLAAPAIAAYTADAVRSQVAQRSRDLELPREYDRLIEVIEDLASVIRPAATGTGVVALAAGFLVLVAATGLLVGSDTARRACRALLVLDAVRALATAVVAVLTAPALAAWLARLTAAARALEPHVDRPLPALVSPPALPSWSIALGLAVVPLASATVAASLA